MLEVTAENSQKKGGYEGSRAVPEALSTLMRNSPTSSLGDTEIYHY